MGNFISLIISFPTDSTWGNKQIIYHINTKYQDGRNFTQSWDFIGKAIDLMLNFGLITKLTISKKKPKNKKWNLSKKDLFK